jgi:hypothetical protein
MSGIGKLDKSQLEKLFDTESWHQTKFQYNSILNTLEQEYRFYQPFPVFVDHFRQLRETFLNTKI